MWQRFCKWLGIRLIMKLRGREPDYTVHSPLRDGLPYLHRWDLIPQNRFFNIYLREHVSTAYFRTHLRGVRITLLGWHRYWLSDNPKHCRLQDVGSVTFRAGRVDMPDVGRSWVLSLQFGK
jgi:hypothetical protein